jgi:uncharacterized protein
LTQTQPQALPPCLVASGDGCVLHLAVVPGARRTVVHGLHDGCLRVRLVAPPVDGKANAALLAWLAAELSLPQRAVRLLRGQSTRRKQVALDVPAQAVAHWIAGALDPTAGKHL